MDFPIGTCLFLNREKQRPQIQPIARWHFVVRAACCASNRWNHKAVADDRWLRLQVQLPTLCRQCWRTTSWSNPRRPPSQCTAASRQGASMKTWKRCFKIVSVRFSWVLLPPITCWSAALPQGPGPAAYKVVDQTIYSKKAPSYSMTGRNFPPGESTQNPGPGAHCPEKVLILILVWS